MGNRNLFALAVLLVAGLGYQSASPAKDSTSSAPTLLRPAAAGGSPSLTASQLLVQQYAEYAKPYQRYIIATVPDPIRTHFALEFDRAVESIIWAASANSYSFQDYYLAWRESPYIATDDPDKGWAQDADRKRREKLPGFLIFSKDGQLDQLAVLLVAESPTRGVDPDQFKNAVGLTGGKTYEIAGPTYSGSLASLTALLSLTGVNKPATVLATAVTNDEAAKQFSAKFKGQFNFATMAYGDTFAGGIVRDYEAVKGRRWARLSEADTTYGMGSEYQTSVPGSSPKGEALEIHFPRELSRLRNAYKDVLPSAPDPAAQGIAIQQGLPLVLKDSKEEGTDNVPSFSFDQTPLSEEALLGQMARSIRDQKIDLAQVTFTDVLDSLFVSRFLRTATPNARLIYFDSDLLYVRAAQDLPFSGVLSVSAYPLFSLQENLRVAKASSHFLFFNALSGAAFEAVNAILSGAPLVAADGKDSPLKLSCRPALWLSTVGRNGYWPVARWANTTSDCDFLSAPNTKFISLVDWPTPTLFVTFIMVLVYTGCVVWGAMLLGPCFSRASWFADFSVSRERPETMYRTLHLLLCTLLLVAFADAVQTPFLKLFGEPPPGWGWLKTFGTIALTVSVVAALALSGWLCSRAWRNLLTLRAVGALGVGLAGWAGLVAFHFVWQLCFNPKQDQSQLTGYFAAWRSLDYANGVAPIVPIIVLLAAFAYWSWTHVQRYVFLDERAQLFPESGDSEYLAKIKPAFDQLDKALHRFCLRGPAGALALIPLLAIGANSSKEVLHSIEPRIFEGLYLFLLTVFIGLMLITASQFYDIWRHLRRFLVQVESHPVRSGFDMLPSDSVWSPIWQFSARRRTHGFLVKASDTAQALADADGQFHCGALEDSLNHLFSTHARGLRETQAEWHAVIAELARLHGEVAAQLNQDFWQEGASDSIDKWQQTDRVKEAARIDAADYVEEKRNLLRQEFVALRYVAFIRYVMLHLRNLLEFLSSGFLLGVLSLNSYAFQGSGLIGWWVLFASAILGGLVIFVLMEMNRDSALSRITNTKVNHLDWRFATQLIQVGTLPLLALISTHIPSVGRFFFSWIQPTLQAFR